MAFRMPDIAFGYRLLSAAEQAARRDPLVDGDHVSPPVLAPARRFSPEVQHNNHYDILPPNHNHGQFLRHQQAIAPPPNHSAPADLARRASEYYLQYSAPTPVDLDQHPDRPFGFPQQALPPLSHVFPPLGASVVVGAYFAPNLEYVAPPGDNQPSSPNPSELSYPSFEYSLPPTPDPRSALEHQSPDSPDYEHEYFDESEDYDGSEHSPYNDNSSPRHSSVRYSLPDYQDSEGDPSDDIPDPERSQARLHSRPLELPEDEAALLDHFQRYVPGEDDVLREVSSLEERFTRSANPPVPRRSLFGGIDQTSFGRARVPSVAREDVPRRSIFGGIDETFFSRAPVHPAAGAPNDNSPPVRISHRASPPLYNHRHRPANFGRTAFPHQRIRPSLFASSGPSGSISPSPLHNDMPPAKATSRGRNKRRRSEDDEVFVIPDSDDIPESSSPVQVVEARPAKRRNACRTSTATAGASASTAAVPVSVGLSRPRRTSTTTAAAPASTTANSYTTTFTSAPSPPSYRHSRHNASLAGSRRTETPAIKRSASPSDFESPLPDLSDVIDLVGAESLPVEEEAEPEKPKEKNIIKLAKFQCVICMDDCTDMTVTHCGHLFCSECLHSALHIDATKKTCPVCRQKIEVNPASGRFTNKSKGFWPLEIKVMTRRRNEKRPART